MKSYSIDNKVKKEKEEKEVHEATRLRLYLQKKILLIKNKNL